MSENKFPVGMVIRLRVDMRMPTFTIPRGTTGVVTCHDEDGIIVQFGLGKDRTWSADVEKSEIEPVF